MKKMKSRLTRLSEFGGVNFKQSHINIVQIKFAFKNHKLINMIGDRGKLISKQKFDKLRKEEEEILKLVEADDTCRFEIPTAAFITFEKPDGRYTALATNKMESMKEFEILPGQNFGKKDFKPAPEPTDIIWENRQYTRL